MIILETCSDNGKLSKNIANLPVSKFCLSVFEVKSQIFHFILKKITQQKQEMLLEVCMGCNFQVRPVEKLFWPGLTLPVVELLPHTYRN